MKIKYLIVFVLVVLIAIPGIFFNTKIAFASCDPSAQQTSYEAPSISVINPPSGTYAPGTVPIYIGGSLTYWCSGNPNGGMGYQETMTMVAYYINNNVGTQMYANTWNSPSCPNPLACWPGNFSVSGSINASAWPAGTYTITAEAWDSTSHINTGPSSTMTATFAIGVTAPTTITGSGTVQLAISDTSPMLGNLYPASSSCQISAGASSCGVNLTWDITNPQGIPTAITATHITNIDVSYSLTTPQSGGPVSVPVPGGGPIGGNGAGGATFFLYNNALQLDFATATSSCAPGSTWNGTICQGNVNGQCALTHYNCIAGTSANGTLNTVTWNWNCNGTGTGTNASCYELIPPPTGLTASCPSPGISATISWTRAAGYPDSFFRIQDTTAGGGDIWAYRIPESIADTGPSTTVPTITGHTYQAWVHTRLSMINYSQPVYVTFSCATPGVCGTTHYTCASGTNASGTTTGGNNVSSPSRWTWYCEGASGGARSPLCIQKKSPGFKDN